MTFKLLKNILANYSRTCKFTLYQPDRRVVGLHPIRKEFKVTGRQRETEKLSVVNVLATYSWQLIWRVPLTTAYLIEFNVAILKDTH